MIEIISDYGNVYKKGERILAMDLISSYLDCSTDKSFNDYLTRIPIPDAVSFIADAWGIEYKFV